MLGTIQQLPLTGREKQISMLCARGYSNREIAEEVFVSENTVKFHLKQIFRKLDIRKRTELIFVLNKKLPERVGDHHSVMGIMEWSGNGAGRKFNFNKDFKMENMIDNNEIRELNLAELDEVNGAVLANIGMGIAGAMGGMATYSIAGGIGGNLSGSGFLGAAVTGFITGFGGFNSISAQLGAAGGAIVKEYFDTDKS